MHSTPEQPVIHTKHSNKSNKIFYWKIQTQSKVAYGFDF
jgi:hypothetical protein